MSPGSYMRTPSLSRAGTEYASQSPPPDEEMSYERALSPLEDIAPPPLESMQQAPELFTFPLAARLSRAVSGILAPSSYAVANSELAEKLVWIKSMQADIEKLKSFKQKAKSRIVSNYRVADGRFDKIDHVLDDTDQRLEGLEERLFKYASDMDLNLKDQRHVLGELDGVCGDLVGEVNHLRADVSSGRQEVNGMLNDVKEISSNARSLLAAQLAEIKLEREAAEELVSIQKENRKRRFETMEETCDETLIIAPAAIAPPQVEVAAQQLPIAAPPSKRARIEIVIPSAAGILAGAVAGGMITWAGLAFA